MYKEWFYLTEPVWNNAFSYEQRENKKLYIPELIEIDNFDNIQLQNDKEKIAFDDFWFDDKLSTNYWLQNFYKIKRPHPNPLFKGEGIKQDIYLFDNHNHAYYFWYLARKEWIIWDNNTLIHIDEHADTRDNNKILLKPDSEDLNKVFEFTNKVLNVGDYIIPAQQEWIIWDIVQIRNETNLLEYIKKEWILSFPKGVPEGRGIRKSNTDIILNLDLDFFQPDLDFIDYELKKKVVLDVANRASVITVATSPFFINQELAVKVFKDIFS
jgi:hypothetical protein